MDIPNLAFLMDWQFYLQFSGAATVFILTFIVLRIVKEAVCAALRKFAERTETKLDDMIVDVLDHLGFFFYLSMSLYAASLFVALPPLGVTVMDYVFLFSLVYYSVRAGHRLIDFTADEMIRKRRKEEGLSEDVSVIQLADQILKYALWVVAALFLLANLGFDIGPLLAGASIGGIAIAFALQNVLTDIFASFSIYFDKPFKVGDFITVGTDSGTVKKIGIKTTRLQTLQGEELVISNKQLTESRINNFKRMDKRRVVFGIGVIYQTPVEKLEAIPKIVSKIIDANKVAKTDRVYFKKFSDSSLDFEIIYYVDSADYALYLDTQAKINLEIVREFQKQGIDFAYPTRTIFMEKGI